MARALVTGGTGFVGSNLCRLLVERGWNVRCLVRPTSRTEHIERLGVELVVGTLDDVESLRAPAAGVDAIFHVAGRTTAFAPPDYHRDNVGGTRRVAEAAASQPTPPVMVMVSSLAAGGPSAGSTPRREADRESPVSHYGRSKLAAERAASELSSRLPLSIVRPPMVFGPADRASLALFTSLRVWPFHLLPGLRGFPMSLVYVEDLCDAMIRVADRGERADGSTGRGVYYVATDRVTSYAELGRLAATAAGMRARTMPFPRIGFWIAGFLGEMVGRVRKRPALLNLDKVREATAAGWVCSDAKIHEQLQYAPTLSLEQRYAQTVAWYREQKWL